MSHTFALSVLGVLGAGLAIASCANASSAGGSAASEGRGRGGLASLAAKRVFFGHQSVGANIIDGLETLESRERAGLRIAEVHGALGMRAGTFGHAGISYNGAPFEKIESFRRAFEGDGAPPDVAMMKFCYVDFSESTDLDALFARYRQAMAELRERFPATTFVHVTVPITAQQRSLKSFAKAMMGKPTAGHMNAVRERFNAMMRDAYAGREPVLDLAKLEATGPDGAENTTSVDGRSVRMLVPAYTDDGEHLNAVGGQRVARALAELVASLEQTAPAEGVGAEVAR